MSNFLADLAGAYWLYIPGMYFLIFFSLARWLWCFRQPYFSGSTGRVYSATRRSDGGFQDAVEVRALFCGN